MVGQNQLWAAFEELSCEMFLWEEPDLTLRQLDSVVPAGFHSGDFSSQEQIRIENWRCGALCLGPACKLSGRCWYADSPEGLDLLWAVDCNKALNFQVYLLCKGNPWCLMESTLAPARASSFASLTYLLKTIRAVACQVTVRSSFGKGGEVDPFTQSPWCYQDLLSLLWSVRA